MQQFGLSQKNGRKVQMPDRLPAHPMCKDYGKVLACTGLRTETATT